MTGSTRKRTGGFAGFRQPAAGRGFRRLAAGGLAAAGALALASGAFAQTAKELSPGETVPANYAPIGIQAGSFLIYPSMVTETEFDDNIFRTEDDEIFDKIVKFQPSLSISSDWAVHALGASIGADIANFIATPQENYEDFNGSLSGRLDILPDELFISALVTGEKKHEGRGTADDPGTGVGPNKLVEGAAEVTAEYNPDQFLFRLTGEVRGLDFFNNGAISNKDRDRILYLLKPRVGFEFQPGTTIFAETWYDKREFINTPDDTGFDRSSEGFRFLGGVTLDLGEITFVELSAGYFIQDFEDPALSQSSGFDFEGTVYWAITDVMTLTGALGRATQDTTAPDASSVVTSSIRLRLDWEADDNLLLTSTLTYFNAAFEGESDRIDDQVEFGMGLQYFFHENFYAGFEYDFTIRESNTDGADFINNRWIARIGAQI